MTGTWNNRSSRWALAAIAIGAFIIRVFPFLGVDGAWHYRVDYDEGVYFSAALFVLKGVFPYRDFVFVHPPGNLLFLAATTGWTQAFFGLDGAFALSRWLAALIGVVNVLLVARLTQKWTSTSPWGPIFSAAFYASYSEVVQVERGPFLEPLLNLLCLLMVLVVVRASSQRGLKLLVLAGALAGLAMSVKVWAVIWVLGALWGISAFGSRRQLVVFLVSATLMFSFVVLPFALQNSAAFLNQVGLFHLWRPPDGTTERLGRLEQIVALRHLGSPLLAVAMVLFLALRRGVVWTVAARILVTAYLLTLIAFFASAAWWNQYNAHLIASEAVIAGACINWVLTQLKSRARVLALGLVSLSICVSVSHTVRRSRTPGSEYLPWARSSLRDIENCVWTFEPSWSLAANRLPPLIEAVPLIVDIYAHQLLQQVQGGRVFANTEDAFMSDETILPILDHCRLVVLGERGHRQLSPYLMEHLRSTHVPTKLNGLEVWQQQKSSTPTPGPIPTPY